jgi:hypothetical protein
LGVLRVVLMSEGIELGYVVVGDLSIVVRGVK